jgi:predicted ATP-dependent endonuclease of OLD family
MYISKLEIKNFRNYENFSINLKPFVTIIGENNVGKSNLLEAIYLVLSHDISVYKKRRLEVDDINFEAIDKFKNSIIKQNVDNIVFPEVRIDLYFLEPDEEQETVINDCWYDFSQKMARISYVFRFKQNKKENIIDKLITIVKEKRVEGLNDELIKMYLDFPIDEYEYSIVCGKDDKTMDNYWLKFIKMEYLDALRDAKTELGTNSNNRLLYRILSDYGEDDYSDVKDKMIELDKAIKENKNTLKNLKNDIESYLEKLSLETETNTNEINFEFCSLELSEILKRIGVRYGESAVSIERNGLGRNNLLFISVVLAHLNEKKDNNYFRLIAIEEPEAHLCPILQKHLAKI